MRKKTDRHDVVSVYCITVQARECHIYIHKNIGYTCTKYLHAVIHTYAYIQSSSHTWRRHKHRKHPFVYSSDAVAPSVRPSFTCVFICMCIHMYECMCIYAYVCMFRKYLWCACMYLYVYVCVYACMQCTYVCLYMYTYPSMYLCMYTYSKLHVMMMHS